MMEVDVQDQPRKKRKLSHAMVANEEAELPRKEMAIFDDSANGVNVAGGSSSDEEDAVNIEVVSDVRETRNADRHEPSTPGMSKNQLKKLRKREEWEAGRDYRRAKRKQKTVEKKARKRAAREDGASLEAGMQKEHRPRRPVLLPITFVIDCGFDDLMSEKERISLGSQLTRSYSDNSRAPFQAHLVVSSWGGLLRERFDTTLHKHYENWKGITFDVEDFVHAAEIAKEKMTGEKGGKLAAIFERYSSSVGSNDNSISADLGENGTVDSSKVQTVNASADLPEPVAAVADTVKISLQTQPRPEPEVVYLTSDSPYTLDELRPNSTYIIGGLVDKNRHKGICYRTACDKAIKTAKLPISDYMDMQSRFVLATNHVVEIMLRWLECGDWGEAFMKVIPKRKGGKLKEIKSANGLTAEDDRDATEDESQSQAIS